MLTFLAFLSLIITEISAISIDASTFETIYQNPESRRTNQLGEACIKLIAHTETGGYIYCKSANNDIRECLEITHNTGVRFIFCTPPVQTQIKAPLDPQLPSKPDDKHDDGVSTELCSALTTKIETMDQNLNQKIDALLNKINNLHIAAGTSNPAVTVHRTTDETTDTETTDKKTDEIHLTPLFQWQVMYKVSPDKLTSIDGEECFKMRNPVGETVQLMVMNKLVVFCDIGDPMYAHLCTEDPNTNQIECKSQPWNQNFVILPFTGGDAAAVQLRNNDNVNSYEVANDSDGLQEKLKMSLISMWVVLALILMGNAIFIWCYMKRNKQRIYDLE